MTRSLLFSMIIALAAFPMILSIHSTNSPALR
jgi:hypothetical protein